jgi:SRSO17 transposase
MSGPPELTAYEAFARHGTTLEEIVRVAGTRWTFENVLEAAKRGVGLDHYEVRSWTGWYRHMTLAMWALGLLAVLRAGNIAVEALNQGLPPIREQRNMADFKARRGLACR